MSLLQDQDFVIYRIRSRYLQSVKDDVGERLITVNPNAVNVPAFKNAGWGVAADIKRTYSPPIRTGAGAEYFAKHAPKSFSEEATPAAGFDSSAALGTAFSGDSMELAVAKGAQKPVRKMRDVREEDDSSDMSDDSDDDDTTTSEKPQKIQFDFSKKEIPNRPRAGSSPIRNGPQVFVTSPSVSKRGTRRLRGGSHGDVEYKPTDADNLPAADEQLLSSGIVAAQQKIHADIARQLRTSPNSSMPRDHEFDSGDESDASSTMSSDFIATADSNTGVIGNSLSPPMKAVARTSPAVLHALPPPIRPVSQIQPVSLLSQLLKAKETEADNPMEAYRFLSGKGELTPIHLKLYIPFSAKSSPFEVIVNRLCKEDGRTRETTVAEVIGFALYKYIEEKKEPELSEEKCDINWWVLRMVDDGEPDDDFPPLTRTEPITAYMTKKTRARFGANREQKMEGEFALCEATREQFGENTRLTPNKTPRKASVSSTIPPSVAPTPAASAPPIPPTPSDQQPTPAPTLGPSVRQAAADASAAMATYTPRTGPSKILRIHVSTIDEFAQSISICVTTDTYISEVLDQVCRKKHLDKSKFMLKLTGTPNVFAPLDRTVASLENRSELDLIRKRFIGAGEGLGDRPGSPSTFDNPNAPLVVDQASSSRPNKKEKLLQPSMLDMLSSRDYLKFTVWRKASMSFMSRHERVLAIDGEYIHIMPSDQKTLLNAFESQAKTRSIHISTIIGCKTYSRNPSNFKILVLRPDKEHKRYDFEAVGEGQANEVVTAIKKATKAYNQDNKGLGEA